MAKPPTRLRNPDTGEVIELVGNQWVPVSEVPKIDPVQFADAQASLEDISGLKGRANRLNTGFLGWAGSKIGGTPGYDLAADVLPVQARGMIGKMIQLKQASPTGATGFGNLSEAEGETIRSTMGNLNVGQSTDQFRKNLNRAEELIARSYPGLTKTNPIDLSAGQSRKLIPKGSYYKSRYNDIRRNDNFDAGNPIIPMDNAPQVPKGPIRVNTPDEAKRLPPGTVFITPDGRQKVR